MRYCTNCGNFIGDKRFCTKCGTDNGENSLKSVDKQNMNINISSVKTKIFSITIYKIQVLIFALSAIIMFVCCIGNAEENIINIYLSSNSIISVIIYFIIGMWAVIPATVHILAMFNESKRNIITLPFIMIIMFAAMGLMNLISSRNNMFEAIFSPYLSVWLLFVLLSLIIIVLEFADRYRSLGGEQ